MRRFCLCVLAAGLAGAGTLRADNAADAVAALAQLTNPARLALLSDEAFAAQLGPALGWLHVARRRDISPEAVIARAFQVNRLDADRARLTRDCLLRNLARADGFALFQFPVSAQAVALGAPAVIQTGAHRGRLAGAALIPGAASREFSDLVLRSDDEPPLRAARRPLIRPERPAPRPANRRRAKAARAPSVPTPPIVYDDALPVR